MYLVHIQLNSNCTESNFIQGEKNIHFRMNNDCHESKFCIIKKSFDSPQEKIISFWKGLLILTAGFLLCKKGSSYSCLLSLKMHAEASKNKIVTYTHDMAVHVLRASFCSFSCTDRFAIESSQRTKERKNVKWEISQFLFTSLTHSLLLYKCSPWG